MSKCNNSRIPNSAALQPNAPPPNRRIGDKRYKPETDNTRKNKFSRNQNLTLFRPQRGSVPIRLFRPQRGSVPIRFSNPSTAAEVSFFCRAISILSVYGGIIANWRVFQTMFATPKCSAQFEVSPVGGGDVGRPSGYESVDRDARVGVPGWGMSVYRP